METAQRGEYENEHRPGLEAVVEDVAEEAVAVRELPDLRDDGGRSVAERRDVHVAVHDRQAEKHHAE